MRIRKTQTDLTLNVIAGSHVVVLGINLAEADCEGLLGFAIHRTDHEEAEAYWLEGLKTFEETDPGFAPGAKYPSNHHPIQGFSWSDFTAKPGRRYTYKVVAMKGTPASLEQFKEVSVTVTTESEAGGVHNIHFNRGAAASQEFARRFGNVRPDENNPDDPRWAWLSRGAMEAIAGFVGRAQDASFGLRVCAYEFRLDRFAKALKQAADRHADVQIVYECSPQVPDENGVVFPRDANRKLAEHAGILELCTERVTRDDVQTPPLSHNKFIVLLKDGEPVAILTGSSNFSPGGVFGQSNVVHIVEDPLTAAAYLQYWKLLQENTSHKDLRKTLTDTFLMPVGIPPLGILCIFSPRQKIDALEWYGLLAQGAEKALFMTFAFGINEVFKDVYRNGTAGLRYALLDKLLLPGVKKDKRPAAEAEMLALRKMKENRFAVGNQLSTNRFDRWVKEKLSGLNQHVQFIHTKFLIVDPLGDDPIVVTGSANFSDASSIKNDENMLVIRGDTRVADIYLGEYMRLWNHYAFREWASKQTDVDQSRFKFLDTTNRWWRLYFGDTAHSRQRLYFSSTQEDPLP